LSGGVAAIMEAVAGIDAVIKVKAKPRVAFVVYL
jgi:hypothetical protein